MADTELTENGQIPTEFIINVRLLEATLNYLAGRPYSEVAQLIHALSQCRPVVKTEPEPEVKNASSN